MKTLLIVLTACDSSACEERFLGVEAGLDFLLSGVLSSPSEVPLTRPPAPRRLQSKQYW